MSPQLVNSRAYYSQRFRILQGQTLSLQYVANDNPTVRAWARVRYDTGEDQLLFVPDEVMGSDRVVSVAPRGDVAIHDGWVVDAKVEIPLDADVKRGQVYVRLGLEPYGCLLCSDYVFSEVGGEVALGTYRPPGPAGGAGDLRVVTVKAAGVALSTYTFAPALSNMVRKIIGAVYYFEPSATVADRVQTMYLRTPLGAAPGSHGAGSQDVWVSLQNTLSANEDGNLYADEKLTSKNDNGTVSFDSNPNPYPLWITDDMPSTMQLLFDVTNLDSPNDEDAIYAQVEEWVVGL